MTKKKIVSRKRIVNPNKVGRRAPSGVRKIFAGIVEGRWECTSCGTRNIPGFKKVCPNCPNPKGADETYQPPENFEQPKFLSKSELEAAGVTADHLGDQQCVFCGYFSQPGTKACPYCSANLKDVAYTCRECMSCGHETNLVTCPQCGQATEVKDDVVKTKQEKVVRVRQEKVVKTRKKWISKPNYSVIPQASRQLTGFDYPGLAELKWIAAVFAVIGILAFTFWPRQKKVSVNEARWTYTIHLQEHQYNPHEGWSVPNGADYTSGETRIHHYDTIIDGYHTECEDEYEITGYETVSYQVNTCEDIYSHTDATCYDDGSCDYNDVYETVCHDETVSEQEAVYGYVEYCEEVPDTHEEPRYATWYFYMIWEWININSAVTSSQGFKPYWSTDYSIDETHRESGRSEKYHISLITEDHEDSFNLTPESFSEYRQYRIGSRWLITHSGIIVTKIEALP